MSQGNSKFAPLRISTSFKVLELLFAFVINSPATGIGLTTRRLFLLVLTCVVLGRSNAGAQTPPVAQPGVLKETDRRLNSNGKAWRFEPAPATNSMLPRVLLIGDSILNGYLPVVIKSLEGRARVDAWVNPYWQSAQVNQLASDILATNGPYAVIAFNMGLHGWPKGRIKEGTFVPLTLAYVGILKARQPQARLIWNNTTPALLPGKAELNPGTNSIILAHNRMAAEVMAEMNVPVNNLYSEILPHLDLGKGDGFHWQPKAYQILGAAVSRRIINALQANSATNSTPFQAKMVRIDSLPALPPMPAIPKPLPPGSVAPGDPKNFPETKLDFPIAAGPFAPTWNSINTNYPGSPAWLRDAKFGIWVHFGPQSAGQSGDWYARKLYDTTKPAYTNHLKNYGHPSEVGYKEVLRNWNPKSLNPAELVNIYHAAGARFLIIQGVHHDNFDNWNSHYQPWNSVNLGPHRDLLGEWSAAARKTGMHFGVSFHHEYTWWWYQTAFGSDQTGPKAGVPYDGNLTKADGKGKWWDGLDPRLLYTINLLEYSNINNGNIGIAASKGIFTRHLDYAKWYATWWALRIMDVIDQYDPDFIYTDGNSTQPFTGDHSGSGFKCDAAPRVVAHFYNHTLQKRGRVDTFGIIKFHPPANGIVTTQEGTFPRDVKTDQPWIGENAVGDWFYAPDFTYDAGAVIRCLLEYVSRDGNYAVCVSLQPDGSLDEGSTKMLQQIGEWLRVNGEGIYGSKGWLKYGEGEDASGKIKILPAGQLGRKQADFQFTSDDFRFTVGKDGSLYAWCLTVPEPGGTLKIKSLGTDAKFFTEPVKSVALLGSTEKPAWRQNAEALEIDLPKTGLGKLVLGLKIN